jgi:hypothetical protein
VDPPEQLRSAMPDQAELLSKVPLFSTVPKKDLRVLARAAHDMT